MSFLIPIQVGDLVSLYTKIVKVGRSSIQVFVEVWIENEEGKLKVTEGLFVLVALDTQGRTRSISN